MPEDLQPHGGGAARRPPPDPHGQAALLLFESLLHVLLEKGALTIDEALVITTAAAEVKEEVLAEQSEPESLGRYSLELIDRITASLRFDQASDGAGPSLRG